MSANEIKQEEIIRMAREAGGLIYEVDWCFEVENLERFYQAAFEAGAAHEREACAKESLKVLDDLQKETVAQCQQGMIEAYKLGQSEEREACAKLCEKIDVAAFGSDRPAPNDCAAAIRARGEK